MSISQTEGMNRQQRREMERQQRDQIRRQRANRADRQPGKFQPAARGELPFQDRLAGSVPLFEALDGHAGLRNALRQIAVHRGEWAGIPMPMEGDRLIVEPTYPKAAELMAIGASADEVADAEESARYKPRNTFWSWRRRQYVTVWEKDGKLDWGVTDYSNTLGKLLSTVHAADAWGVEQEARAVDTLGTLVRHRMFKQYLLTGMFMEASPKSGIHYLFRRLRPTVAISMNGKRPRVIACLCLHPIAYYADSWAGAMCPTDDVIAHLMLMRGDEHMFWRRANQHPPWDPAGGIAA